MRAIGRSLALVAALFGLVTIAAGTRVLAGADPGYLVFRPLLIYNASMGFAYVAAGVLAFRRLDRGAWAAAAIFALNLIVLATIGSLYASAGSVAIESVRAMSLRTAVWLLLFLGMRWAARAQGSR